MTLPSPEELDRAVRALQGIGVKLDLGGLRTLASLQEELARERASLEDLDRRTQQAREAYLELDRQRQWKACDVRDLERRVASRRSEAA